MEGEQPVDIRGIKSIILLDQESWKYWVVAAALVIFLLILFRVIRRYLNKKRQEANLVPQLSPFQRAMNDLHDLKEKQLVKEGEIKEYYFLLSEIFRRFIEGTYHFPALEYTTEEIMPSLPRTSLKQNLFDDIRQFLSEADQVKFAKFFPYEGKPENDWVMALSLIRKIEDKNKEEGEKSNELLAV